MEDQDYSGKSEHLINSSPTPVTENSPDPAPSPSRDSSESEGKTTLRTEPSDQAGGLTPPRMKVELLNGESRSRAKGLSEAFWEGVSSAKPGNEKQSPAREAPPVPKNRPSSSQPGLGDWLIKSGKSAAAGIGESVSSLGDSIVNLAKKTPSVPTKWGEAFREGSAKVRTGAVKPKAEPAPPPAGSPRAAGKGIWDSVSQIGDSAAGFVRDALVTFIPGEAGEIEKIIRLGEKKIKDLYVEIGREAAESWSRGGPAETEKVSSLLDEFRKQEDIIRNLRATIPKIAPAKKAEVNKVPPNAPETRSDPERIEEEPRTEAKVATTPGIQEVVPPEVDLSPPIPDKPVEPGDRQESGIPEEEMILAATPGAESLTVPPLPEDSADSGPAVQEEADAGSDQNLSAGPEGGREKTEGVLEKQIKGNRREE